MTTLIISTAKPQALVVLVQDGAIVAEHQWPNTPALGRELLSVIDTLLAKAQIKLADINQIAVHQGPGHYSALRHGIVTATTLAFALGIAVLPIEGEGAPASLLTTAATSETASVIVPRYQ